MTTETANMTIVRCGLRPGWTAYWLGLRVPFIGTFHSPEGVWKELRGRFST
jgi:hypothetical protein